MLLLPPVVTGRHDLPRSATERGLANGERLDLDRPGEDLGAGCPRKP